MSVICQNFVQNAWKKDLCSNCFKSVGDHEHVETVEANSRNSNSVGTGQRNGKFVSQASIVDSSSNGTPPHTTWKSLISEKNGKNSQPFKLENGFQGRLLTINKAINGTEKQHCGDTYIKNKNNSQPVINGTSVKTVNGVLKNQSALKSESTHIKQNGSIVKNENNLVKGKNSEEKTIDSDGTRQAHMLNKKKISNGHLTENSSSVNEQVSSEKQTEAKFVKSNREEAIQEQTNLHSILKKNSPTPPDRGQPRRSSNVGFKDEEPLVIGYGGRDFSPEELEWDMASDGESESTSDSLDETEDDKVFSKMTKQNTEFNSDNANLLDSWKQKDEKLKISNKKQEKQKENSLSKVVQDEKESDCRQETPKNSKHEVSNVRSQRLETKDNKNKNNINDTKKGIQTSDSENVKECDHLNSHTVLTSLKSNGKTVHSDIKATNDSINVAIKSDKTSHASKTNEFPEEKTEETNSGVDVKNSPEFINGAAPPSSSVDASNTKSGKTTNAVMFSDGGEETWQENALGENNQLQDDDAVCGQILQAINTSLTNRHKMRENPDVLEQHESMDARNENAESETKISVSVNNDEANTCDDTEHSIGQDESESILSVEPRESFLHGISKPSAIYGPASDLFVSRSNSSSSSSSDEQGKSQISLSFNVTVNGEGSQMYNTSKDNETNAEENLITTQENNAMEAPQSIAENKTKPDIPAKPTKHLTALKHEQHSIKIRAKDQSSNLISNKKCDSMTEEITYYSIIPEGMKTSINLVDPYAESNIYQEVNEKDIKTAESESEIKVPGRESKLAALAIELEQVRHTNTSTKRQAPAPPKVPEPPLEDPPSCTGRASPNNEVPHNFPTFRGESMGFSSASSTTSTSSQDTEAGYTSWNLHGDLDDAPKHKSKSFLLAQYSKCKMLAMGYAEDGTRARKKFSIKKLLKIGKETESPLAFDPNCPNPKAWKYSDHFERPRAKLEIIHPMDLENKSVTVNPGFDSLHSGTMSSFSTSHDDVSFRNSVSSDYGSFYSDTLSPGQDLKQEVNYEYIQPRLSITDEQEESSSKTGTSNSTSPTPSRSSTASQASTMTSGSSKNGHRPPKPPPPPRAHSLLPGNKIMRNLDGTFKFPAINGDTSSSDEVTVTPSKPQAPRRQCKSAIIRPEYLNSDEHKYAESLKKDAVQSNENIGSNNDQNQEGNCENNTSSIHISHTENQASHKQQDEPLNANENIARDVTVVSLKSETPEDSTLINSSPSIEEGVYDNVVAGKESKIQASITIKTSASSQREKLSKSMLSRNKHPPLTKAPARPPPIYSKPQSGNFPKNHNPWKTLEDSYMALTSSNRELLIKLVNQALKKSKNLTSKLDKLQFQWSDFEIDASQPSSVFAFGEKIAYHATMPSNSEYDLTLVISIQQQSQLPENSEVKYPVFGKFTDCIPSELLDISSEGELESVPATVLVLDRSNITTIECFSESLPESLTEENEKEICYIILQLIQSLKSLQVQGIESIDSSFQDLVLAKTKYDKYHTLIFLYENCYDESSYSSDSNKISLCQYTFMLLFQILKLQVVEDIASAKFSSNMSRKVFETAFSLLSEEKAVSLSQTKTLFECYLWGVTKVLENIQESEDCDSILQRWLDIERSNFIKSLVNDEDCNDLNVQNEYYSQFLIRTNARNIKEIASYL